MPLASISKERDENHLRRHGRDYHLGDPVMRAPTDTQSLDFTLQKLALPSAIGDKVLSGDVRLVVMPCRPQPMIDHDMVTLVGIAPDDDLSLIHAIQSALDGRMITPPIPLGHAFELGRALPAQYIRLGTALVRHIGISRLAQLTTTQLRESGHSDAAAVSEYWCQAAPDIPIKNNPWCWLIYFDYKGGL